MRFDASDATRYRTLLSRSRRTMSSNTRALSSSPTAAISSSHFLARARCFATRCATRSLNACWFST